MAERIKVRLYVPREVALEEGSAEYGEATLEPSGADLALLTLEERTGLDATHTIRARGMGWVDFVAGYRARRAIEQEKRERQARELAEVERQYAQAEPRWDADALEVRQSELPYLSPEASAYREYRERVGRVVQAGVQAADALVESLERAEAIVSVGRAKKVPTPRAQAIVERAREEAERRAEQERAALRLEQRLYLQRLGTAEQLERFDAGVLPAAELEACLAQTWPSDLESYRKITRAEVLEGCSSEDNDEGGEGCKVQFLASDYAGPFEAEQWARLKQVRARFAERPHEFEVRRHRGYCVESHHEVSRLSVRVSVELAGVTLERHFAL